MTVIEDMASSQIPATWSAVSAEQLQQAKMRTLVALDLGGPHPVAKRLANYYDVDMDYAGATFVTLGPIDSDDVTATDLHAIAMLNVKAGPGATRRLLEPCASRSEVLAALRGLPDSDLLVASPATLAAMETMYLAVKGTLSASTVARPNAWVTAAKLCARKRPDLFPVRDHKVCAYLGLATAQHKYQVDWQMFRFLIGDKDISLALDAACEQTMLSVRDSDRRVEMDVPRLRLLDAALWTYKIAIDRAKR